MASPQDLPHGSSTEVQGSAPTNRPGVYRHRDTGAELIAGREQHADAFVRQNYEYVGPAPARNKPMADGTEEPAAPNKDK